MTVGSKAMVFFSGIPSDAAGPVVERVTPTLMSACAIPAALNNANAASLVSTENLRVDFILAVSLVDALVTSCLNDSAGGRPFLYFSEVTAAQPGVRITSAVSGFSAFSLAWLCCRHRPD